ncbi:response regulator [Pseudomonas sp. CGJS7]|uniref:response regulator n=1 Tax=Pseudomonas sp. CGJS7 TaxID=3109348 RepID=UPI0030092F05
MKYVVADHQPAMARLVDGLLRRSQGCSVETVRIARSSERLQEVLIQLGRDACIVVLDPAIPGLQRIALVRAVRQHRARVRLIVHAGDESPFLAARLIAEGVSGYVLKSSASAVLAQAIRQVRAGDAFYDPSIDFERVRADPWSALTPKQQEVCVLILRHGSIGRVAERERRNYDTLWMHWSKARKSLGIEHGAELAKHFYDKGLMHLLDD